MEYTINADQKYLCIPVQAAKEAKLLELFDAVSGEKLYEFMVPCGEVTEDTAGNRSYGHDYYGLIPMEDSRQLLLKGEFPEEFFAAVCSIDEEEKTDEKHPALHFTAKHGWLNDPNGLVFDGTNYHLYFQFNPMDVKWQNMSWGHAISQDLLHWEQLDTVMFPDEQGQMFSGCGLMNEREMLGLPKDAMLYFFTAAAGFANWSKDLKFTQRIAYSTDGGATLTKLPQPCLAHIAGGNRDPKIYLHEKTASYVMVLYLKDHDFMILRSADLMNWEESQRLTLEDAWECPDLRCFTDEDGREVWLFWSADGYYFTGSFDGYTFTQEGPRGEAYINKAPYAAQTYSDVSDRTITIPWLRLPNEGELYTGAMGIPRELSLRKSHAGYALVQQECRELRALWKEIEAPVAGPYKLVLTGTADEQAAVELQIGGSRVAYQANTRTLTVGEEAFELAEASEEITLLVDHNILEIDACGHTKTGCFKLKNTADGFSCAKKTGVAMKLFIPEGL